MKNTPHGSGFPPQADLGTQLRQEAMRILERAPSAVVRQLLAQADKCDRAVIEVERARRAVIETVFAEMESLPANERKVLEERMLAEMERLRAEPRRAEEAEEKEEAAVRAMIVGTAAARAKHSAAAWALLEAHEKGRAAVAAAKAQARRMKPNEDRAER